MEALTMPDVVNKGLKISFPAIIQWECEHEMGEPDLSFNKKVQQQLLAPVCKFQPLPSSQKLCSKKPFASAGSSFPPSESPASLKAGLLILFLIRSMGANRNSLVPTLHFCKKIFAAALCVLILLPESGFTKNLWKRALHLKLTEKYDDYEYPLHSHSANHQKNDRCPPPPQTLPERACEVTSCRSDSECERHKRCCYNGCIYACLESVQPPPVLDWLVQPKPRWLGGNGWLLDGPEEVLQAEACSTTEDGDEPLRCPTGYECHIISPGNMAEGIPNRGQCIKLRGNADGRNLRHKYYKEYFGSSSNNIVKQQQKHLG